MRKTKKMNLNLLDPQDPVERKAINENFEKLDNDVGLSNGVCDIMGIPHKSTVEDAFIKLGLGIGHYGYKIRVQLPNGDPVPGAKISGLSPVIGSSIFTDEDGFAIGKSTATSVSISVVSPWVDVKSVSGQAVTSAGTITDVTVTLALEEDVVEFHSSGQFEYSPKVTSIDFSALGAGGGGGGNGVAITTGAILTGGGGGGGGFVKSKLGIRPTKSRKFAVEVGSPGQGGAATTPRGKAEYGKRGSPGGSTAVKIDGDTVVAANGGQGGDGGPNSTEARSGSGYGNGIGGPGNAWPTPDQGTAGTGHAFDDPKRQAAGGGGGGGLLANFGGVTDPMPGAKGGSPNGGRGCGHGETERPLPGGVSGGGGGGGGNAWMGHSSGSHYDATPGANGGPGRAYAIFHHE